MEFRVRWEIELDADNPVHAARTALAILRDPQSIALVFSISVDGGRTWSDVDFAAHPD